MSTFSILLVWGGNILSLLSQKCINCKGLQQMKVFIWNKSASNVPLCLGVPFGFLRSSFRVLSELFQSSFGIPLELWRSMRVPWELLKLSLSFLCALGLESWVLLFQVCITISKLTFSNAQPNYFSLSVRPTLCNSLWCNSCNLLCR